MFQENESFFYTKIENRRKKIITMNFQDLLDPCVLAVWFMDDGGRAQNTISLFHINVTSFTCLVYN